MRRIAALLVSVAALSCAGEPAPSMELWDIRGQTFHTALDPVVEPVGEPAPPPRLTAADTTVSGPFAHENLSVFFLHQPGVPTGETAYLSLEEALKAGVLKITEKGGSGTVNELEIENSGDRPIYLQAGDAVKGGKQDRSIGIDFVLPPRSGKTTIDAFCVEPGRWAARTTTGPDLINAPNVSTLRFAEAEAPVATKEQKLAIKGDRNQAQVWAAGKAVNRRLGLGMADFPGVDISLASYVVASENPEVRKKCAEFSGAILGAIDNRKDVIGMAYAVNGELNTIEIYSTPSLFLKLWPKLLKGASLEAIAKKTEKPAAKAAAAPDVEALLDRASKAEGRMRSLPGDMRLKAYFAEGVALFDTEKGGELLHRQVILK